MFRFPCKMSQASFYANQTIPHGYSPPSDTFRTFCIGKKFVKKFPAKGSSENLNIAQNWSKDEYN